jgi:hypothetical protein
MISLRVWIRMLQNIRGFRPMRISRGLLFVGREEIAEQRLRQLRDEYPSGRRAAEAGRLLQ